MIVRKPTGRQLLALKNLGDNGGNKRRALLDAGYSKKVADNPGRVFGSAALAPMMRSMGLGEKQVLQALKRLLEARRVERMDFPPYDHARWVKLGDIAEIRDDEICNMIAETGGLVKAIVHTRTARRVYFWNENDDTQLRAADILLQLLGAYPPRRKPQPEVPPRTGLRGILEQAKRERDRAI